MTPGKLKTAITVWLNTIVMVWGGISYDDSTDLYVIRNGSLTGIRYRDEILAPIVRFYAGANGVLW
jgi:hypothetical protein